jgi:hypothetical protein
VAYQVRSERQWLNHCKLLKLMGLSAGEVSGIPSVAVKCVDIRRNTSGEGDLLDCY